MGSRHHLRAGQVVYGKLPPQYAAAGAHDFTNFGFTPGFCDERAINAIQWYLLGETPPRPDAERRRIFARVGRGAGSAAIMGELRPASFRDGAGRTEQYVAHFLMFDAEQFEREAGGNPFYVFDQFAFV